MRQLKITKNITSRNSEALDRYLTEIAREPMLTPDEEAALAQTIHKGGKEGEKARQTGKRQPAFCCLCGQTVSASRHYSHRFNQ